MQIGRTDRLTTVVLSAISKNMSGVKRETDIKTKIKSTGRIIRLHRPSGENFTVTIDKKGNVDYKFEEPLHPTVLKCAFSEEEKEETVSSALYKEILDISREYLRTYSWHILMDYLCGYVSLYEDWRSALSSFLADYGNQEDTSSGENAERYARGQTKTKTKGV